MEWVYCSCPTKGGFYPIPAPSSEAKRLQGIEADYVKALADLEAMTRERDDYRKAFIGSTGGITTSSLLERMTKDRDWWRDSAQKELDRANAATARAEALAVGIYRIAAKIETECGERTQAVKDLLALAALPKGDA